MWFAVIQSQLIAAFVQQAFPIVLFGQGYFATVQAACCIYPPLLETVNKQPVLNNRHTQRHHSEECCRMPIFWKRQRMRCCSYTCFSQLADLQGCYTLD